METTDIQLQLQEKWMIFWWALGVGLFALGIAWRQGLFKPFHVSLFPLIRGVDVLKGFGLFLFIELLIIPVLVGLIWNLTGEDPHQVLLRPQIKGWVNLLIILGGFGAVTLAYLELTPLQRQQLWNQTTTPCYVHVGIGIATWFVCYPLVLAFSQLVSLAVWHLFHHSFIEQVAVQNLRHTWGSPGLFGLTAFAIMILVPMTEEFLFRGLLQSWLKRRLHHTPAAIGITSLIFALFHYSSQQGMTNIELLSTLFLLSCVLGFLYERQRSLWAPVGLHGFFNFMSLLMLLKES